MRALAIDCQTVDLIDVTIDNFEDVVAVQWRWRNVPNDDEVVKAGADENILGRRMPFELRNFATMAKELDGELGEARRQAAFWDVPQLDSAVVRGRRNLIVIEWIPLQVENLTGMTDDLAPLKVDAPGVIQQNHDKRRVSLDGQENWIDRANVAVMSVPMNGDVGVAFLLRRPVNMTEFRWSNATKPELKIT